MARHVVIPVCLLVSLCSCEHFEIHPSLSLTAHRQDGIAIFYFKSTRINGLLDFRVFRADTGFVLWDVNLNYYAGPSLTYGVVPKSFRTRNGVLHDASQYVPVPGQKPQELPQDVPLYLAVDIQYDSGGIAACMMTLYFTFTIGEDGYFRVTPITRPTTIGTQPGQSWRPGPITPSTASGKSSRSERPQQAAAPACMPSGSGAIVTSTRRCAGDRDADASGTSGGNGLEEVLYFAHDANMNVTAAISASGGGGVVERYTYDANGKVTFRKADAVP